MPIRSGEPSALEYLFKDSVQTAACKVTFHWSLFSVGGCSGCICNHGDSARMSSVQKANSVRYMYYQKELEQFRASQW